MLRRLIGKVSVVGALVISLAACEAFVETRVLHFEDYEQVSAEAGMNEVVFVDFDLNRKVRNRWTGNKTHVVKISVDSQGIRRTATGTSEVWAILRNHTSHPQQLEARTSFFDADKVPVDAPPQWKRLYLPANSISTYKELSVSQNITSYIVEIKGAE